MQANVQEIMAAALGTELFETVRDRMIIGQDDLPAFNVFSRNKSPESADTALKSYNGPWVYGCMITMKEVKDEGKDPLTASADFVALENLFKTFCAAMLGGGEWELVDDIEMGTTSVISGKETLGVVFSLAKQGIDRYGN